MVSQISNIKNQKYISKIKIFQNFTFYTVILIFAFYILNLFPVSVFAQGPDIGVSRLHPASPLYFLKSAKEILEVKFAATGRVKVLRELEFATRRLREVKALLPVNQDLIEPTMERYSGHINSLPDKHQEKDELGMQIVADLDIHLQVLEQIYSQVANPRAKMALRLSINRLSQRLDILPAARRSICRFFFREASASALNEVERAVLTERAKKCLINS